MWRPTGTTNWARSSARESRNLTRSCRRARLIQDVKRERVSHVVYSLAPDRTPAVHEYRSPVVETRADFALSYKLSRPQINPLIAVRDAGRDYGRKGRPVGPEAILHAAWRNAGLERASVRGRDGHAYRVVYGGRPGGSLGPDFTDAVVERDDGVVFRGDIEIHVRESDWRAHGHHRDPRYNGVVLHVVAAESEGRPAIRATGASIPLLALNWKVAKRRPSSDRQRDGALGADAGVSGLPASGSGPSNAGPEHPKPLLNAPMGPPLGPLGHLDLAMAGLERFHAQAAGIALDIGAFGADQAVWLGVMGALGYPRNKRAFRALAQRVPWGVAAGRGGQHELERLLIRAAGLGEKDAVSQKNAAGTPDLPGRPPGWVRPWGRPANSPVARIKAISALVPGWASQDGIASACARWVSGAGGPTGLAVLFRPAGLAGNAGVTVLGKARAAEIVVNVLLPAVFAMAAGAGKGADRAQVAKSLSLKNRVLALFDAHPRLAENSLTEEARVALGVDYTVPAAGSARDQQGLIALYRQMFRRGIRPHQTRLPGL